MIPSLSLFVVLSFRWWSDFLTFLFHFHPLDSSFLYRKNMDLHFIGLNIQFGTIFRNSGEGRQDKASDGVVVFT